jgi:uncharacterized membrane protein YedE/YeeE
VNAYTILSGGVVGVAFGAALQRGRFCINTGFRDVLLIRDATMVRAWALAVAVQMASVAALNAAGWLPLSVPPLWWAANIAGGLSFGAGMVLAGGCSSGTCYRVGEGMAGSILALLGFGAGILLASRGALTPLESWLRSGTTTLDGAAPTLANVLGVDALWVSLAIATAIGLWLWRTPARTPASSGWSWRTSGLALGGIGVAAWLASTASGRNYGLSMTGPLRTWFNAAFSSGTVLDWGSVLLAGLIAGSFLSAWWHRELRWRVPQGPRLLQSGAGGIVMGVGAQIAGGCNIGHSLTGLSVLSLGSALTTACIVLGAWLMAYLLFVRPARMAAAAE